ncbi:MAG: cation transporter, partial [Bacteroidota bacterium]
MRTLTLKTDLHCQGCVNKVSPLLEQHSDIKTWSVDLEPDIKTLTVKGDNVSVSSVNMLLQAAGYSVIDSTGFWTDLPKWNRASFNTLNCLIGCSIGDFGMVFFLQ